MYEVWMEGYLATGMEGRPCPAQYLGEFEAESFKDACKQAVRKHDMTSTFNEERLTIWGCRLYNNEHSARQSFG